MIALLLIGCYGTSSSDDTATDTGWQDDFEWEDDGSSSGSTDDTTGTDDTQSGGTTETDTDTTDTGTNTEDTNSGSDTQSGTDSGSGSDSSRTTYTVCLSDLDSDVVSLSLNATSTTGGDAAEAWLVWQDGQDFPCANLTGSQDEIFEIDGLVTFDDGTTSEFVFGESMFDTVGDLEMADHNTACYAWGDNRTEDGVYRCMLPDIFGEPN